MLPLKIATCLTGFQAADLRRQKLNQKSLNLFCFSLAAQFHQRSLPLQSTDRPIHFSRFVTAPRRTATMSVKESTPRDKTNINTSVGAASIALFAGSSSTAHMSYGFGVTGGIAESSEHHCAAVVQFPCFGKDCSTSPDTWSVTIYPWYILCGFRDFLAELAHNLCKNWKQNIKIEINSWWPLQFPRRTLPGCSLHLGEKFHHILLEAVPLQLVWRSIAESFAQEDAWVHADECYKFG